jgi:hypothetical protein
MSNLPLLVGILFGAPIPPGIDDWPMTFRGWWEVTDPRSGIVGMTLEMDGTCTVLCTETNRNREKRTVEYLGTWLVYYQLATGSNGKCFNVAPMIQS